MYIQKLENGTYRAQIKVNGVRKSSTFKKKAHATEWANSIKFQLDRSVSGSKARMHEYTCVDIFKRWEVEVLPTRNGKRWDKYKIARILEWKGWNVKLIDDLQSVLMDFRDYRLKFISNNSCNRELNLISSIFTHAIKEWKLAGLQNPVKLIKRPPYDEKPRKERWSDAEIAKMYKTAKLKYGDKPENKTQKICYALSLAVESAMRIGEICNMKVEHYFREEGFVHLPHTKNGTERDVPLTDKAIEILDFLIEGKEQDEYIFDGQNSNTMGVLFAKLKKKAGFEHKHFHDARHEAATRLSKVFNNTLELSAVTGHKKLDMLKRYYNPTGSELRRRLQGQTLGGR
nr:integrase [Burkholderiaceae bacterium]